MGLKDRTLDRENYARKVNYLFACMGLFILSIIASMQMAPRDGRVSFRFLPQATHVHAQDAPALRLRFVDSETDERMDPDALIVDDEDVTSLVSDGQLELPAKAEVYMVTVFKDGYELMEEILVEPSQGGYTEFRLFSSDWWDRPDDYETYNFGHNEGRILGYIRDRASGAPLYGATVRLDGKGLQAAADERGYFELDYTVATQDMTDPAQIEMDTLRIAADGYITQERLYVHLFGGMALKYLVNLDAMDPALNGAGSDFIQTIDERLERGGAAAEPDLRTPNPPDVRAGTPEELGPYDPALQTPPVIDSNNKVAGIRSHTIRLGLGCQCRTCSTVQVMNLDDYSRYVLPREWISGWSMNSLEAGAVAVRSYGGSFIVNPISRQYDICSNACCQVFGPPTNTRTDRAIRGTRALFVVRGSSGTPLRAEYSAENNLASPCRRNGFTGTCLSDQVCLGFRTNGHGRGMCQWGSQRWGSGAPRSGGPKNKVWILNHYYKNNPGYRDQNVRLGQW